MHTHAFLESCGYRQAVCLCTGLYIWDNSRKPRKVCVPVLSGHAIPLCYIPDFCGCIAFGLEADLLVRDLKVTKLTLNKGFILHVPQPTKLVLKLVTLMVDECCLAIPL